MGNNTHRQGTHEGVRPPRDWTPVLYRCDDEPWPTQDEMNVEERMEPSKEAIEAAGHTRSCAALVPGDYEDCTCALNERIQLAALRSELQALQHSLDKADAVIVNLNLTLATRQGELQAAQAERDQYKGWWEMTRSANVQVQASLDEATGHMRAMEHYLVDESIKALDIPDRVWLPFTAFLAAQPQPHGGSNADKHS